MYYKNAMRSLGICLIIAILSPLNHKLKAQNIDYSDIFWLYGQSTYGITFRKSDFTAELDSIQNPNFGIGGSAVATDPITGDLLFYSDGDVVYDKGHQLISGYTAWFKWKYECKSTSGCHCIAGSDGPISHHFKFCQFFCWRDYLLGKGRYDSPGKCSQCTNSPIWQYA